MINQMFLFSRPFWARVDPFWIISNNKRLFCSKASLPNLVGPQIDFCLKWSKRVPNCQKHLGLPFRALLDPFGTLWTTLACFIGVFFGTHYSVLFWLCIYIDFNFLCCTFKSSRQTSNVMRQFVDSIFLFFSCGLWSGDSNCWQTDIGGIRQPALGARNRIYPIVQ